MKTLYTIVAVLCIQLISAQESGKFRMDVDAFYAIPSDASGVGLTLEPKFNIADNMSVGLRISNAFISHNGSPFGNNILFGIDEYGADNEFVDGYESFITAVGGTFDYYFDELTGSSFTPFAGAGAQYVLISGDYDESSNLSAMVRAGFEVRKFRFSVDYNILPSTTLGVSNSYIGIHLGVFIGGGKW